MNVNAMLFVAWGAVGVINIFLFEEISKLSYFIIWAVLMVVLFARAIQ